MNSIAAVPDTDDYAPHGKFLNIQIDGEFIDELLDRLNPGREFKGLISILSYELDRDIYTNVVTDRILPGVGQTSICPVVICPDDLDFSCSLLVAEIKNTGTEVIWERIGVDKTKDAFSEPDRVGEKVEWLEEPKRLRFEIEKYEEILEAFKSNSL